MSLWPLLLLAAGVLWTIAGTWFTTVALVFKDGVMGGSGPGWSGVALLAAVTAIGPAIIVLAAVNL